jgi:hypothetical protein
MSFGNIIEDRKGKLAIFGIIFLACISFIFLQSRKIPDKQLTQVETRKSNTRDVNRHVRSGGGDVDFDFQKTRDAIYSAKNPEITLLSILAKINKLDGIDKDLAVSKFVGSLTDFENPQDALFWLKENRTLLYKCLSSSDIGQGRSLYDEVLSRIENLCAADGTDFIVAAKSQGDRELAVDILPFELKSTGSWNNGLLDSLEIKQRQSIESRTIRQLALANFANDKALSMMLDDGCSIESDSKLTNQVIQRDYFWNNSDKILEIIESSGDSKRKDDSLVRVVTFIAERDKASARQWAELITDNAKRDQLVKGISADR